MPRPPPPPALTGSLKNRQGSRLVVYSVASSSPFFSPTSLLPHDCCVLCCFFRFGLGSVLVRQEGDVSLSGSIEWEDFLAMMRPVVAQEYRKDAEDMLRNSPAACLEAAEVCVVPLYIFFPGEEGGWLPLLTIRKASRCWKTRRIGVEGSVAAIPREEKNESGLLRVGIGPLSSGIAPPWCVRVAL